MTKLGEKAATVLLVDDMPDNIRMLGEVLKGDYQILISTNGEDALRVAEESQLDIILLDIMMPGMNGYEVCQRLRAAPETSDIPIIFVSAMDQIENEVAGLEMGAIDYLTKPINPTITRLRVKNQLELKHYRDFLAAQSLIDGLTGIPNRRRFDEDIAREWQRSIRSSSSVSLMMIDIDFFKPYNDTYGHLEGDSCLRMVAESLQASLVRGTDLVARYGGEEFACLLPETDIDGAAILGERFRQAVLDLHIPHEKSDVGNYVTVSIGAASMAPVSGMQVTEIIQAADSCLYKAKHKGRNQLVY